MSTERDFTRAQVVEDRASSGRPCHTRQYQLQVLKPPVTHLHESNLMCVVGENLIYKTFIDTPLILKRKEKVIKTICKS